jgi:hypothetical protein
MKNPDEWGKEYHSFVRESAKALARMGDSDVSDRDGVISSDLGYQPQDFPPIKQWLSYYRDSKMLGPIFIAAFLPSDDPDNAVEREGADFLRQAYENDPSIFEQIKEKFFGHNRRLNDRIAPAIDMLEQYIQGDRAGADADVFLSQYRGEFLFAMSVYIPCIMLYGSFAGFLYRRARCGDVEAICNLLELDKRIIGDHRIADAIHRASLSPKSEEFRKICKAFSGRPYFTSKKKLKIHQAGLVSSYLESLGFTPKAPEIQSLFDTVHHEQYPDEIVDPDLHDQPHTFYQAYKKSKDAYSLTKNPLKK